MLNLNTILRAWSKSKAREEFFDTWHTDIAVEPGDNDFEDEEEEEEHSLFAGVDMKLFNFKPKGFRHEYLRKIVASVFTIDFYTAQKAIDDFADTDYDISIDYTFENGVVEITGWHEAS